MKIDAGINDIQTIQTSAAAAREESLANNFKQVLNNARKTDDQKELYKSCQQMESVFLNKVLDSMRSCISYSNLIDRGFATETYESMLFQEYADSISKTSSLGIADVLYKQLSTQLISQGNDFSAEPIPGTNSTTNSVDRLDR